jgi:hypothetical protein
LIALALERGLPPSGDFRDAAGAMHLQNRGIARMRLRAALGE